MLNLAGCPGLRFSKDDIHDNAVFISLFFLLFSTSFSITNQNNSLFFPLLFLLYLFLFFPNHQIKSILISAYFSTFLTLNLNSRPCRMPNALEWRRWSARGLLWAAALRLAWAYLWQSLARPYTRGWKLCKNWGKEGEIITKFGNRSNITIGKMSLRWLQ